MRSTGVRAEMTAGMNDGLQEALREAEGTLRFAPVVDPGADTQCLLWVRRNGTATGETFGEETPLVGVRRQYANGEHALYSAAWEPQASGFVHAVSEVGGLPCSLTGTGSGWQAALLFADERGVESFYDYCSTRGVSVEPVDLVSLDEQESPAGRLGLSTRQYEALQTVYDRGYFEIPKEVTLTEVAAEMEISEQALSRLVRRGVLEVVERALAESNRCK